MQKSAPLSLLIQNFKQIFENHPVTILIGITVFVLSALTTLINDGGDLINKANASIGWRGFEEKIINSLNASISIEKFQETLGQHIFYREGENGYSEYVFERREGKYWIQAITDQQGVVVVYTVTSCDSSFRPRIRYSPRGKIIRLGESTFKEAADGIGVGFNYFVSGATSNSYLIEEAYLGNPGKYQTEFWGIIDACDRTRFYDLYVPDLPGGLVTGELDINDPILDQFRGKFAINTYAISSPLAEIDIILEAFQIGVDRLQIRVVYP
jgi:hypothetical protein